MMLAHLSLFFSRIREDHRITHTHISLFMALFVRWSQKNVEGGVEFRRSDIMEGLGRARTGLTRVT